MLRGGQKKLGIIWTAADNNPRRKGNGGNKSPQLLQEVSGWGKGLTKGASSLEWQSCLAAGEREGIKRMFVTGPGREKETGKKKKKNSNQRVHKLGNSRGQPPLRAAGAETAWKEKGKKKTRAAKKEHPERNRTENGSSTSRISEKEGFPFGQSAEKGGKRQRMGLPNAAN